MTLTLFHAPHTRSLGVLLLLEELGAPYELHVLDRGKEENRAPAYLAINPLGKVPALRDGEAIVTEQVAIFLYLADKFPAANLAPRSTMRCAALTCAGWCFMPPRSSRLWSIARAGTGRGRAR